MTLKKALLNPLLAHGNAVLQPNMTWQRFLEPENERLICVIEAILASF